jgi:RNA polymerase sigma factor (sigma-70 family)
MSRGPLRVVLHHLHRLTGRPDAGIADAQLLQRFAADCDEAAFELLLWRHGPMVRGVCRRLLRHHHDAEDAFQATFLTLVRKAPSIGKRESLAGWLYRVAYRVALRARDTTARRPATVTLDEEPVAPDAASELVWRDLRPVLDEEVSRLPRKYSLPIILCYLQGKTYDQAARELGCPKGTLAIRLQRARELLRGRLTRRGVTLSAGMLTAALTEKAASAAVPAALLKATTHAALVYAAGQATAVTGAVSAQVVSLTEGVLRSMFLTKLKVMAAVVLLSAGLAGAGAGLLPRSTSGTATAADTDATAPASENKPAVVNIPAQRDGVLLFIGTDLKDGEQVAAEDVITVKVDGEAKKYRRLREGDKVEDGQLLARLDDRLARDDVEIKKAKLEAAEAELRSATNLKDDAQKRFSRISEMPMAVGEQAVSAAKLTFERSAEELNAKAALVKQAKLEVKSAETVVEMHEIRAVKGTIKAILKQPREAVKNLETVFQIQTDGKPGKPPVKEKPRTRAPGDRQEQKTEPLPEVPHAEPLPYVLKAEPLADVPRNDEKAAYYTRTATFYIPFAAEENRLLRQILLYVSEDLGKTYRQCASAVPSEKRFQFTVPGDGIYWFVLQTVDAKGQKHPPTDEIAQKPAALKVCVDRKEPSARVTSFLTSEGKAGAEWEVADENLDLTSLRLEYQPADGRNFIPLPIHQVAKGRHVWDPIVPGPVKVRLTVRDKAQNEAIVHPGPQGINRISEKAGAGVRFINSQKFELDWEIDNVGKSKVKHVEVWVTKDEGKTWGKYRDAPPQSPYEVELGEGRYGFTLVAVSGAGSAGPRPKAGDVPQLWVEVDVTMPKLGDLAVSAEKEGGQDVLAIVWKVTDKNLSPTPITISYAPNPLGPWQPIDAKLANTGKYLWRIPEELPAEVYVRVDAVDLAGNTAAVITTKPVIVDTKVPMIRIKGVKPNRPGPIAP